MKDSIPQEPPHSARNLSQLNFAAQHWWKDRAFIQRLAEGDISIEEQKAAVWYEAARRRPEVQQAWLEGQFSLMANGWQFFTNYVVNYLIQSWLDLDTIQKASLIHVSYGPWSVPPEGYSTFPTHQEQQRKVAVQVLKLPDKNDADAAQRFVEHARQFADNGFVIVAVDKKQKQAIRAACAAIEALPPTFRKADFEQYVVYGVPPNISQADEQELKQKEKEGTLTNQYMDELWRKYPPPPTNNLSAPWHKIAEGRERVLHKRARKGKAIEGKKFNFESICHELEAFDTGCVSDFVNAVRL
ncbi:MAG TPA: hypothetical protein VGO59_09565 [Verrucomicrobiae bacterium]